MKLKTPDTPDLAASRVRCYYGWVILVIAALAMTGTLPGRTHGLGLVTKPLLEDLHIDEVSSGPSRRRGLGAAAVPSPAALHARTHSRREPRRMTTAVQPEYATQTKFHLSLNVSELARSVGFYRVLFGREPAKCHADYAKFELADPPVVFSLVPQRPGAGGTLSHIGLRVADDAAIQQFRERLEAAGICTQAQDGTVCGYARQNKCWVKDPDGTFWEIYVVEEDVPPDLVRKSREGPAARVEPEPGLTGPVVWEHFVTHPLPDGIPRADATVDEVRLTGTFNADLTEAQRTVLVREALRALRPGGKMLVHGLMADKPFAGPQPKLPGLAAMVSRVPVHTEPLGALRAAGFVGVQVVKFPEQPWFVHEGAGLREVKLIAWKPGVTGNGEMRQVLYKGPFGQATADGSWVFPRGRRVTVPAAVWQQLRQGASAEHFLFLEPGAATGCSGVGRL